MKKITFLFVFLLTFAGLSLAQSNVLIIDYNNSFSSDMSNNGSRIYNHLLTTQTSVTRVFSIPGSINVAQYQQVWIFGNMGFPTSATLNPIIAYMNSGGAVYVQSEVSCCNNQAAFVDQLIDSTTIAGGSIIHNLTKSSYYQYDAFPALSCSTITHYGAAVRPFIGTPTKNILFEANPTCGGNITTGDIVGVRFCSGDMISGKGALISNGDFNIFPLNGTCGSVGLMGTPNNTPIIDFIADLLTKLACDTPSTGGQLVLTANPQYFCGSTQLGWTYTPGTGGCGIIGCSTDTTYKWSVVSGEPINVPVNFSCDTCPYPIASPSIVTTYMLTITVGDTNACNQGVSAQIPITVYPMTVPFSLPITYSTDCNGNMNMSLTSYQGSLQWQISTGGGPFTNIPGANAGTYAQNAATGDCFRVEITSPCGTAYSDTVCQGILTPPIPGNVTQTADCQGNVSLNLTGYVGDLQWQSSAGGGPWTDISGANLDSLLQSGVATGDCFRVKVATACDTVYSDTACAVIPTFPDTGQIGYIPNCTGTINFWVTGTDGDLQWQTSTGGGPWTDISGATTDSIAQPGVSSGDCFRVMVYTVCDTVYTDTVCMGTLTPPVPGNVTYTADCQGNVSLNLNGSFGDLQWQSSAGGGPWTDISGATLDSLYQSGVVTGDCFRVKVATICDTLYSDTACIVIPTYPDTGQIAYEADCKGNVDLWVTGTNGNLQWQVSLAGGPWTDISGATTDSVSQSGISTGDCFRVMVYTVCDTVYTDTVCPTMFIGPIADFSASPPGNSQSNVPVTFTDNSTGNIVSWTWIFGDNSPAGNTHIPNPTHTYHNTGIYYVTLIVEDANGCTDTVTIPYIVDTLPGNHLIIIPNVFTPNGDGDNDFLVFKNLEQFNNHLQVYNRWGTLIYEATNYKNGWDGEKYSEGTYYFLLDVYFEQQGEPERFKGNITLLR
ncbi:MAG: gliding motility-associated C-terminal domain-containing protein [Flavobacteriales bacterium]|nr:gliding motility-associated C-terminal domain-containing protein [Flavobacteriales bacterium]